METNAAHSWGDEENKYFPIDTIKQQAFIKRLPIHMPRGVDNVVLYGDDNLYPNKALETCNRSKSTKTATKTLMRFIKGEGWNDDVINKTEFSKGLTGSDILHYVADYKSKLGFALHVNYNIAGEIVEIQPIDFENLRYKLTKQGLRFAWRYDWQNGGARDEIIYNLFNPEKVKEEIAEVGIENYTGQIYYWTGTRKFYPLATFDEVYDEAQFEAEQGVFKIRNIQNDFKPSGAIMYPKVLNNDEEFKNAKAQIKSATQVNNTSSVMFIGLTEDSMEMAGKIWQPFERNNVDKLYDLQNKDALESIYASFQQPLILNGIEKNGMFNQASFMDAFHYYNSVVEDDRKSIERVFKNIFDNSIWNFSDVTIKPKEFLINETNGTE